MALDWLLLGDTVQAIRAISETFRQSPRYDVRLFYTLWRPSLDGIRNDPRFQEAFSEALDLTGLTGAMLRRAPSER